MSQPVLVLYADGAARGNPGPAGAGVVLSTPAGDLIEQVAVFLGTATNNVAEYRALVLGLAAAARLGAREVTVRMDSELVVRQMSGRYRVKNPALKILHAEATALRKRFAGFTIEHVPRAANSEADRLANQAIDEG